ncbi:MAG: hypothetical protein AB8C40_06310 [Gammaproteobacteria bacterium]
MSNDAVSLTLGIASIIFGAVALYQEKYESWYGVMISLGPNSRWVGFFFILFGIICFWSVIRKLK